ncbi:MAG: tetratricopeptide repeat protein [Flavipsychrobacter sp.]|nr:tetratricopeptide repeat protein [Flavipsychrobacter sp.]
MRRLLAILLLILFINTSYGQVPIKERFDAGVQHLKANDFFEAKSIFSKLIEMSDDDKVKKMSYIYRGFANEGLGKYTEAINDYNRAIVLDSNDDATYIDRGKAYIKTENYKKAEDDFKYVIKRNDKSKHSEAAYYYLAQICYYTSQYKEAVEYYTKLLVLAPNDAEAYFNRGAAKGMYMDVEGSISDYDAAIKIYPQYKEAFTNRGVQKINLLTSKGKVQPESEELKSACNDLSTAMKFGDERIDLFDVYCTDLIKK